eukprot:403350279
MDQDILGNIISADPQQQHSQLNHPILVEVDESVQASAFIDQSLLKIGQSGGTSQNHLNSFNQRFSDQLNRKCDINANLLKNSSDQTGLKSSEQQSQAVNKIEVEVAHKDRDLVSKILNFRQNYHEEIAIARNMVIFYYKKFDLLDTQNKIRIALVLLMFGILGLTIQIFGVIAAMFLGMIGIGVGIMNLLLLQKIRKDGLITYFPGMLKRLLLNWSIYDILCEIFYFRTTMIILANIITPFMHCHSPDEAKEALDSMKHEALGPRVHAIIFRKGLVNNLPERVRSVMVPQDEKKFRKMTKVQRAIARLTTQVDVKQLKKGQLVKETGEKMTDESDFTPTKPKKVNKEISQEQYSRKKELLRSTSMMQQDNQSHSQNRELGKLISKDLRERMENMQKRMNLEQIQSDKEDEFEDSKDNTSQAAKKDHNFFGMNGTPILNKRTSKAQSIHRNEFSFNDMPRQQSSSQYKSLSSGQQDKINNSNFGSKVKFNASFQDFDLSRKISVPNPNLFDITQESSGACPDNEEHVFNSATSNNTSSTPKNQPSKHEEFKQVSKKLKKAHRSEEALLKPRYKSRNFQQKQGYASDNENEDVKESQYEALSDNLDQLKEDQIVRKKFVPHKDLNFISLFPHGKAQQKIPIYQIISTMLKSPVSVIPLILQNRKRNFQIYMKNEVNMNKLKLITGLFVIAMLMQLKYSKSARQWASKLGQFGLFASTAIGIMGTVGTLIIKRKIDQDWETIQEQHQAKKKHEPIQPLFKRQIQ